MTLEFVALQSCAICCGGKCGPALFALLTVFGLAMVPEYFRPGLSFGRRAFYFA